jgi:hypothetical protein
MNYCSMHKSTVGEAYMQGIQEVFKLTLLDTLVTHVGIPSSGIKSNYTCTQTDLGILKPSIDQPIGHLIL